MIHYGALDPDLVAPTATATPTRTPVPTVTAVPPTATTVPEKPPTTPFAVGSSGGRLLSKAGQFEVVIYANGRIEQDNLIQGREAMYLTRFTFPAENLSSKYSFNGVSATLFEDSNNDGELNQGDRKIAGGGNGLPVTLEPGRSYFVNGSGLSGGFAMDKAIN